MMDSKPKSKEQTGMMAVRRRKYLSNGGEEMEKYKNMSEENE